MFLEKKGARRVYTQYLVGMPCGARQSKPIPVQLLTLSNSVEASVAFQTVQLNMCYIMTVFLYVRFAGGVGRDDVLLPMVFKEQGEHSQRIQWTFMKTAATMCTKFSPKTILST